MVKLIKIIFYASLLACAIAMSSVIATYFYLKPNLPEISLVDESQLQLPLKIYTQDKMLIGEYGEIKRRPVIFNEIPNDLKNAFLAAEDDRFFEHQGISYTGIIRSFIRCIGPNGCLGGGGTISMQVVRGYVLTRDQTIIRKLKEIYLAYELEGKASKEEIFELYVNRIFLGNRSYGIQAASNTYFNKSVDQLTLSESATIAALAQLPSVINPIKSPLRTKQRRNWILSRMLKLNLISKSQYIEAISDEVKVVKNIDLYEVDAKYLAELARQEIIKRFGLKAYKEGWNVYTTINSSYQTAANKSVQKHLADYDKRHGWRLADNYKNIFSNQQMEFLSKGSSGFLKEDIEQASSFNNNSNIIGSRVSDVFSSYPYYESHVKGIVAGISDNELLFIDENLDIQTIN